MTENAGIRHPGIGTLAVRWKPVALWGALGILLLAAGWSLLGTRGRDETGRAASSAGSTEDEDGAKTHVELSDAKLAAANIRVEACERRVLRATRIVPARVAYDESRHVAVRTPVDGVVRSVSVKPGDEVRAGDTLAVVSSSSIGTARADALQREAEFDQATRRSEWKEQVARNTEELVASLRRRTDLAAVEKSLEGRTLGDSREKLMSAYSKYLLADALAKQLQPLADQGIAEGRVVRERNSNRQVAEAGFLALCEQSLFDARQDSGAAQAARDDARRRLEVARHHLTSLIGREETQIVTTGESLSLLEVRSPISGTVEERTTAAAERVSSGDSLFVVADISRLWVRADLREKDWEATTLSPGAEIRVQVPALANRTFGATVHFMGRTVSGTTHSIPLVALLDNDEHVLRPGMFARVSAPVGDESDASPVPAVPAAAMLEHDGGRFVFVEERPGRYRRADIEPGRRTAEWVEIVSGAAPGDRVVVEGMFVLKSELLLEAEE